MPSNKRKKYTEDEIKTAYEQGGSLNAMADILGITYPTANKRANELSIDLNAVGYKRNETNITNLQCRHAREFLNLTRDEFCLNSGVSKTTLREFELNKSTPRKASIDKILGLFKEYNIVFFNDGTFKQLK